MRPILASYEALCPCCHRTIELGAEIRYSDDLAAWVHGDDTDCVEVRPTTADHPRLAGRPRCPTCADLLDQSGACLNCGTTL